MTDAELAAGVAAAIAYEGWFDSSAIGEANNEKLVTLAITAADASPDQTGNGRQASAVAALTAAIAAAGASSEVTSDMINGVTAAVLQAVSALRTPPPSVAQRS